MATLKKATVTKEAPKKTTNTTNTTSSKTRTNKTVTSSTKNSVSTNGTTKKVVKNLTPKANLVTAREIVKTAKKEGKKEVVVYTTKRNDYKKTLSPNGYGSSDLKSNILEFYVGLIKQYGTNITTRAVSFNNHEMEYVVKVN
jgi:hypothetical protein